MSAKAKIINVERYENLRRIKSRLFKNIDFVRTNPMLNNNRAL